MTTTTVTTQSSKPRIQSEAEEMISNLKNVLPTNAKIAYQSTTLTPTQAVAELQGGVQAITAAATAKLAYVNAVATKRAAVADLRTLVAAIALYLKATVTDAGELASCGIQPAKKRAQLTAAEQAAKSAKALATRAANKTQGVSQKRKAALAASATTVVLGPNGQPIGGASIAAPAPVAAAPVSVAPVATGK